ncbi:transcription termination factor NusA [bacterium]|nr:transcription termination factor NusA [bacterium]
MNYEILEALGQIAREKNVDKDLVIQTLEAGIVSAARRRYGANADIRVVFDQASGGMKIEYVRKVVDDLTDEELEIELDDAQIEKPDISVGDDLVVELSLAEFGRNAIQAAKQVVVQRVREAERDNVFESYHNRVGEVVTGTVQQVNRGNIIVNLGRAEALLPWREQIRREQYRQGDTVRALIIDVQRNTKGPQIILSRGSGDFLVKLFQQEVPEIMEGIVRIEAVAREAGGRSKIAVSSNELRVDPVGACVGMKGSRVQGIVRELSGERIDIVPYSDDPIAFVTKALSPARILQTIPDDENKRMKVIVTEDQLSLAIGKSGQNARLAAKLSGWEIDLVSESDFAISRGDTPRADHIPVSEMEGLGPKTVDSLVQSGFESVQDIVKATIEDLINVPGVGDVTAQKIYLAAVQHIEAVATQAAEEEAEAEEAAAAAETAAEEVTAEEPEAEEPEVEEAEAPQASAVVEPAAPVLETPEVPAPAAPKKKPASKPGEEGSYLDDLDAMESELSAGWEDDAPGDTDKKADG